MKNTESDAKQQVLPEDSVLLPLCRNRGALLLSRQWAVFCRIPEDAVQAVKQVLQGQKQVGTLLPTLKKDLTRHGFFDQPRTPEIISPAVRLQITNDCNLNCAYCCTDSGVPRPQELDEAGWMDAVDQARAASTVKLRFDILGGEPLLCPFVIPLANYIQSKGNPLILFTNGTKLADPDMAKDVAALATKGMAVRVSLAGPSSSSCDALSDGKRFDAAVEGIGRLAKLGASAHVTLMLFPQTISDTIDCLPELRRRLPNGIGITFGIPYLGGREKGDHMFPTRAVLEGALDRIAIEAGQRISFTPPSPLTDRREACHCAFGNDLHIRSDAVVYNCFKMEEPIGSLGKESLARIWRRAKKRCRPAPKLTTCSECALATLCGGGCRSENALYTGDPDRPLCGPWRQQILADMLADDCVGALTWPTPYLINEAVARGFDAPKHPMPRLMSISETVVKKDTACRKTLPSV